MPKLSFSFQPSEYSHDHQARVLIDGVDILADIEKGALGIDPVEFFAQEALRSQGALLIGRCECGCVGCGDVTVSVKRIGEAIEWHTEYQWIAKLVFEPDEYERSIQTGASDFSWENVERTAERLVSKLDYSPLAKAGLIFQWASGRIEKDKISLSFSRRNQQELIHAPWDHRDPSTAVTAAQELLSTWQQ